MISSLKEKQMKKKRSQFEVKFIRIINGQFKILLLITGKWSVKKKNSTFDLKGKGID